MRAIIFILITLLSVSAMAADKYFKPVSGNLWETAANWFTDSTFTTSTTVPTSADNVYFTYAAGDGANCTIEGATACLNINMRGYRGILTPSKNILNCYGDATILNYNARIAMRATSGTKTIVQLSASYPLIYLDINGAGGTFQLGSEIVSNLITFTNGTFNTNDYGVTSIQLSLGAGTKTLNWGKSLIKVGVYTINFNTNSAGLTLNAQNSTLEIANTTIGVSLGSHTYNIVKLVSFGTLTLSNGIIADTLIVDNSASRQGIVNLGDAVTLSGAFIVKPFNHSSRILVKSSVTGTRRTITLNGTLNISEVDFMDITFDGSNNWSGGHHIGDAGNNSTSAPNAPFDAKRTLYLRPASGTTASWHDTTNVWSTSTSGTPRVVSPLPQDSVIIDNSSIPASSLNLTISNGLSNYCPIPTMYAGDVTKTLTLTKSTSAIYFFGSFVISSSTTITGTSDVFFYGRDTKPIDTKGKTFGTGGLVTFEGYNTTYNISSDFVTATGAGLTLATACTLNVGNYNLTSHNILTVNGRLVLGSSNVTLTNAGANLLSAAANSISCGTSTFIISGQSLGTRQFAGGGNTFWNVYFTGYSTAVTNKVVISGNNTFNELKFSPATAGDQRVDFTAGTTQTVGKFVVENASPYYLYMRSSSTSAYTIAKTTSGCEPNVIDRVDVAYMTGTPASTWKMGANSVDSKNNTNLAFEACTAPSGISKVNSISFQEIKAINTVDPVTISKINNTQN